MWVCACSRPLWVSPMTSPVRLGVSPAVASTPTGVFNQRFEALFPELEPWFGQSVSTPPTPDVPPGLSIRKCGAMGSASGHTACPIRSTMRHLSGSSGVVTSPLCPSCPSSALLLVWMNVSSSPWLSDFREVLFSVSSGCFFVFKLLLSFFWLCEEV